MSIINYGLKIHGRNLAGEQVGTLIGIFPKFNLQFKPLTRQELAIITPILDMATQTVRYYDDNKQQYLTIQTYAGDYKIAYKKLNKAEPFSCNLICRRKRG